MENGIVYVVAAGIVPGSSWCLHCMFAALEEIGTDLPKKAVVRLS